MRIPVGILGATGIVGQSYVKRLQNHPWFDVRFLAASPQSAHKSYQEALQGRCFLQTLPDLPVEDVANVEKALKQTQLVFSALDHSSALLYEMAYAKAGLPIVSNASAYRLNPLVPLVLPEIPSRFEEMIKEQQRQWNTNGFIVTKPNCCLPSFLPALYALHKKAPIKEVSVVTLQSMSGAGYPGVAALDIFDNVVPFIKGEEEKIVEESRKILCQPAFDISVQCTRVPVRNGHMACVEFSFDKEELSLEEMLLQWRTFTTLPQKLRLPSAAPYCLCYRPEEDRPQPVRDCDSFSGMATILGRLRSSKQRSFRFVGLSHNTIKGAAGGGLLIAELLAAKGLLMQQPPGTDAQINGGGADIGAHQNQRTGGNARV